MRVKPARPGLKVPIPRSPGQYLPEGVWTKVPETSYWTRSVRRGDLIVQGQGDAKPSATRAPRARAKKQPDAED